MKNYRFIVCIPFVLLCLSCKTKPAAATEEDAALATITPVTVDSLQIGPVADYIELNATSSYLKKNSVKSAAAGYISQVEVSLGENVKKDQLLFTLKTKEASALDNTKGYKDSTFSFAGIIRIRSFQDGIISLSNRHAGDYVQEGDELCVVSDRSSFVFLLDVPYELHQYVQEGKSCDIVLPDNQVIAGRIKSRLPSMDVGSQTEPVLVMPDTKFALPENLIARVRVIRDKKDKATTLPKAAILSNEMQNEFWVMKLINDSVAVKIPIKKGLETAERTEILEPKFLPGDHFLVTGNYGLADTARVILNETHTKE
jgi:hypothetical protein